MKKKLKAVLALCSILILTISLTGCGTSPSSKEKLNISCTRINPVVINTCASTHAWLIDRGNER